MDICIRSYDLCVTVWCHARIHVYVHPYGVLFGLCLHGCVTSLTYVYICTVVWCHFDSWTHVDDMWVCTYTPTYTSTCTLYSTCICKHGYTRYRYVMLEHFTMRCVAVTARWTQTACVSAAQRSTTWSSRSRTCRTVSAWRSAAVTLPRSGSFSSSKWRQVKWHVSLATVTVDYSLVLSDAVRIYSSLNIFIYSRVLYGKFN